MTDKEYKDTWQAGFEAGKEFAIRQMKLDEEIAQRMRVDRSRSEVQERGQTLIAFKHGEKFMLMRTGEIYTALGYGKGNERIVQHEDGTTITLNTNCRAKLVEA